MNMTFENIFSLIRDNVFNGSDALASLTMIIAAWAICAVICINAKAPAAYSVVPLIPISMFFVAYGTLPSSIMIILTIVTAAIVAAEFKKVVG